MCVICVLCLIVVQLLSGKNPFAFRINNNNNNKAFHNALCGGDADPDVFLAAGSVGGTGDHHGSNFGKEMQWI
jgi:hypothetical protein